VFEIPWSNANLNIFGHRHCALVQATTPNLFAAQSVLSTNTFELSEQSSEQIGATRLLLLLPFGAVLPFDV